MNREQRKQDRNRFVWAFKKELSLLKKSHTKLPFKVILVARHLLQKPTPLLFDHSQEKIHVAAVRL